MKGKGVCVPVSQLGGNENINFETSTGTSTTTLSIPVIEECVKPIHKFSEEIKKSRAFVVHTRYAAQMKATKKPNAKQPNAKKRKK